jgi:hypothetical protein
LMDNKDILKAKGNSAKITNLVGSKLRNVNKSMITSLNTMLLAVTPGAKDIGSIPDLVRTDPTASATIGGIAQDSAINSWWRNKTKASTATTFAALMAELDDLYLTIVGTMSGDNPDLFLTDKIVYETLVAYARSKGTHQFINSQIENVFELGAKGININGATVVWDTGVTEQDAEASVSQGYFLNTDYLQFCVHEERQFAMEGPEKLTFSQGQDATAWVILLMGNLTCSNRAKQGTIYSIAQNITS